MDINRVKADMAAALSVIKARGTRYRTLSKALSFNPDRRFPNLDKVLPLPPAELPPWNGDRDTLHHEHPLREIVNQHWRQAWLLAGQAFPQPQRDWLLDLPERDVAWHLMDAAGESGA